MIRFHPILRRSQFPPVLLRRLKNRLRSLRSHFRLPLQISCFCKSAGKTDRSRCMTDRKEIMLTLMWICITGYIIVMLFIKICILFFLLTFCADNSDGKRHIQFYLLEIQIHNAWQWSLPPFRNLVRNVHHAGLPGSKVHGASLLPVPEAPRSSVFFYIFRAV